MSLRRARAFTSTSLFAISIGGGLALTVPACSGGPDSGSSANGLSSGSGSGSSCGITNLANANVGNSACGSNSLGSKAFGSSCSGNGGSPEYWCADFARWVWGNNGVDTGGLTPAAASFYSYGKSHGTLSNTPHVGDAVVFSNGHGIHHVAIVTQVNSNGTIESVSGDWAGQHGSESHFSSTSHVKANAPAYNSKVGTKPSTMGMTIAGYISPYGMNQSTAQNCGFDAGLNDTGAATDAPSTTDGGAGSGESEGGEGGNDEGGNSEAGSSEGGNSEGGMSEGGVEEGGAAEAGYAFLAKPGDPRRETIALESGVVDTVEFAWRPATGAAAPADLWIEASGRTVLQISSVADAPFVRAGLEAVPLRPGNEYRIAFLTHDDGTILLVVDSQEHVIIRTHIDGASSADVVLPSPSFRSAVIVNPTGENGVD